MMLGRFYCCYLRNARDIIPNFHPILFNFFAYVNCMVIYEMHRERKFPMTITNLAALFLELFEPPSYSFSIHLPKFHFLPHSILTFSSSCDH